MAKKGLVIINLKTYKFGKNLIKLCKEIEKVDKNVVVCSTAADISEIRRNTRLSVFVQHVDPIIPGRNTGFISPEAVKAAGATGVLINHSEHSLSFMEIKDIVKRCNEVKLKTCIFANDLREAKKLKKLKPSYLAIEPKELVASKTTSISSARPDLISEVKRSLGYPFLVGAGVKTNEDYKIAMKLGSNGILLSSAVTTARNPGKILKEIMQ